MRQPYPAPAMGPANSGSPVGAFFLGLLASFVIAMIYALVTMATIKDQSYGVVNALLIGHGLLNGAVVGWLVGLVGRRSTGAHVGGAIVAVLGAFFGFTNAMTFITADTGGFQSVVEMVKYTPLFPAKAWWGVDATGHLLSLLSLAAAAAAAWGVAFAVSRKRP